MDTSDGEDSSEASDSAQGDCISFPSFTQLPPEIRHQIWLTAVPSPGINFFNAHCFPNSRKDVNRSNKPPLLHLDMRRLGIEDDDETVFSYDPSTWQLRYALWATCREARHICGIPESQLATVTLVRPRAGLTLKAGDGKLRELTPYEAPKEPAPLEPTVSRTIQVHVDDMLCISIENCSLNLVFEEDSSYGEDDLALGWSYDPQFCRPGTVIGIPSNRYCLQVARGQGAAIHVAETVITGIISTGDAAAKLLSHRRPPSLMIDSRTIEVGLRSVRELTDADEVFWDRWDDQYIPLAWNSSNAPDNFAWRLTKAWPENRNTRMRYVQSAVLSSPKRLRGHGAS